MGALAEEFHYHYSKLARGDLHAFLKKWVAAIEGFCAECNAETTIPMKANISYGGPASTDGREKFLCAASVAPRGVLFVCFEYTKVEKSNASFSLGLKTERSHGQMQVVCRLEAHVATGEEFEVTNPSDLRNTLVSLMARVVAVANSL